MSAPQTLHNGIRLTDNWPPAYGPLTMTAQPVPYLDTPPDIIPIDVGRQLFVDDFLIERSSLQRSFHQPQPHPANPILKPETAWETGSVPFAMPFSDGVWFDPADGKYKLWYTGDEMFTTCYAESEDGVHWVRPELDVVPGTNIVLEVPRDSSTIWLDHNETDPSRRFKALQTCKERISMRQPLRGFAEGKGITSSGFVGGGDFTYSYFVSPDGIHWTHLTDSPFDQGIGDRSTFWFDPFRQVWVFSIRGGQTSDDMRKNGFCRVRTYKESTSLSAGLAELAKGAVTWVGADDLDPPNPHYKDFRPQLYTLDGIAYESLMIGLFSVHQGPENDICAKENIQKRNQISLGYSRDGFHWHRPDRRPFIKAHSEDPAAWDWGNIQSAGGGFLVVGDLLYFYYSGRRLTEGYWDGDAATGLATLRRDGFASLDADTDGGLVVTRPLRFSDEYLFVNVAAPGGQLRAALSTPEGKQIEGFSLAESIPVTTDSTKIQLRWKTTDTMKALVGKDRKSVV